MKLIRPMLATLASEVPDPAGSRGPAGSIKGPAGSRNGPRWWFEEKDDGIRALAYRQKGGVRRYSRNGLVLEWTADDKLRQPFFFGLRHDTSPRECRWDERER